MSFGPIHYENGVLDLSGGIFTFAYMLPIPCAYYAWRPIFSNNSDHPTTIDGVSAQPSISKNDMRNPLGGARPIFNTMVNAGHLTGIDVDCPRDGAPSLETATGYPFAIPPSSPSPFSTEKFVPNYVAGDWNYISSLDPIAGEIPHWLHLRILMKHRILGGCINTLGPNITGDPDKHRGYDYSCVLQVGDFVTNGGHIPSEARFMGQHPLVGIQFLTHAGVINMTVTGDSHFAAAPDVQGMSAFSFQLARSMMVKWGIPHCVWNMAWGGRNTNWYWPGINQFIPIVGPQFHFQPGWTANEGAHDAIGMDRFFARMTTTAQRVIDYGGVPVTLSPFPRNPESMQGAFLSTWKYAYRRIKASAESHNVLFVDVTDRIGDLETATYRAFATYDNEHPNYVGHGVIAEMIQPYIERAEGLIE